MPDETVVTPDVNLTAAPAVPSEAATQAPAVETPPVGEQPTSQQPDQKVPYPRFKEVIDQRNQYETQIKELRDQLARAQPQLTATQAPNAKDKYVQKLVSGGMTQEAADILADTMLEAARESVAPYEQKSVQREVDEWTQKFAQAHPDYNELEPKMYEVFTKLPRHTQDLIASDPKGLELLYGHVKSQVLEQRISQARQEGMDQAYQNRLDKGAVSGLPGSSTNAPQKLTRQAIAEMTQEEYLGRREEILKRMAELQ